MTFKNKFVAVGLPILVAFISIFCDKYFQTNHLSFIGDSDIIKMMAAPIVDVQKHLSSFMQAESTSKVKKSKGKRTKKLEERMFTELELKEYDGTDKGPYLALLGRVFDVTKGKKHYSAGGGYGFFSGRDASRAFVTGDFEESGLIADVSELPMQDYLGLDNWVQFYEKDYKYAGKLIGLHYDANGEPTPYNVKVLQWISEAKEQKAEEDKKKQLFPGCNSEYFPETGTRVWCTYKSGGVDRDWIGVPRKLFTPGKKGAGCACIKDFGPPSLGDDKGKNNGDLDNPNLEEFRGCPPKETTCKIPRDPKS